MNREMTSAIIESLNNDIDDIILEGLKRKGFDFEDRNDAVNFISKNCKALQDLKTGITTYTVKDIPFLAFKEEKPYKIEQKTTEKQVTFTATAGGYIYL